MKDKNDILLIREIIGEAAVYEQLAEECSELAKEVLKMSRSLRDENPTPVTKEEALRNMSEEFTDVYLCASDLGLVVDYKQLLSKDQRWRNRIQTNAWKKKLEDARKRPMPICSDYIESGVKNDSN